MKFNGLKLIRNSALAIAISSLAIACENKSANNSTTTSDDEKKAAENSASTTKATGKKAGSATVGMTPSSTNNNEQMKKDEKGYYNYTEVSPAYNGGQNALDSYINSNIEYPQQAIDNNVEGTVHVQFAIDEKGNISDVQTIGSKVGYGLEEEAIRVVSQMPQWEPGQVKGKFVKTKRTLPITYKLES